jgi:hypothetical protein
VHGPGRTLGALRGMTAGAPPAGRVPIARGAAARRSRMPTGAVVGAVAGAAAVAPAARAVFVVPPAGTFTQVSSRHMNRSAHARWTGRGRRVGLVAVAVAVAVGVCGEHAAGARPGLARALAACPPTTLRLFNPSGKRVPVRVVIERQGVTCTNAHRLISTYLRRASPRTCASGGTRCILTVGGWTCSFFSAGESQESGGAELGCLRSATRRFTVVPVAKVTGAGFRVATARGVSCEMHVATLACEAELPPRNDIARLAADGTLHACRSTSPGTANGCHTGDAGLAPTYNAGRSVTVGPFRCTVIPAGVRCIVTASGKGFEMTATGVTAIGGATLLPTST